MVEDADLDPGACEPSAWSVGMYEYLQNISPMDQILGRDVR
jgi:hypothetical protein